MRATTSDQRLKAAALVADGKLTNDRIAAEVGVSVRSIKAWRKNSDFQQLVKQARDAWRLRARNEADSDPDFRLQSRNDRLKRLRSVIKQRSKDPQFKDVPGGNTGLLTVTFKMQNLGKEVGQVPIPEYAVDTGLLSSMLALEEAIAIEKGDWKKKIEHSRTDINAVIAKLNAGRQRAADAKRQRDEERAKRAAGSAAE